MIIRLAPRWIDRNLSRLELVVSVTLVAAFIGWFGHYALVIFAGAERAMLRATVTNINTALRHQALMAFMRQDGDFYEHLEDMNPMVDLQPRGELSLAPGQAAQAELDLISYAYGIFNTPSNYLGEYGAGGPATPEGGAWYYDRDRRELVYLVRNTEYFVSGGAEDDRIRFKIMINYADKNENDDYSPGVDRFHSAKLTPLNQYSWYL